MLFLLLLAAAIQLPAQVSWDNSGNGMLSGRFYFRELIALASTEDPSDELDQLVVQTGIITFDAAAGTYDIDGSVYDTTLETTASSNLDGTYRLAASGHGFINRDNSVGGTIYGSYAQDIFLGSSTESPFQTLFVATRVSETPITEADFNQKYTAVSMNFPGLNLNEARDSYFHLEPDGAGQLARIEPLGYIGGDPDIWDQMIAGAGYSFADGVGTLNLRGLLTGAQLISGIKEFYVSPNRQFIFGGSKTGWDFFVGFLTPTSDVPETALNGFYVHAGMDVWRAGLPDGAEPDAYYGSFLANDGIFIGHQRILVAPDNSPYDFTYGDVYVVAPDGTHWDTFSFTNMVSADGSMRIGFGEEEHLGISIGLRLPPSAGSDPFISPFGALNAASFAPFTTGLSRGVVVTLFGSGFASDVLVDGSFPTSLAGVQVLVNGQAAPVYVVAPNQISFVLPYNTEMPIAAIQVVRDGVAGNRITVWVNRTSPGIFTIPPNGVAFAAALHADFSLVTPQNPALPGETIQIFLTGLGLVDPPVAAGEPGPANPLSWTTETLQAFVGGLEAVVSFSGLAPFLGGLYQLNITIPAEAQAGNLEIGISGPDSYTRQALIAVGSGVGPAQAGSRAARGSKSRRKPTGGGTGRSLRP